MEGKRLEGKRWGGGGEEGKNVTDDGSVRAFDERIIEGGVCCEEVVVSFTH